MLPGRSTFINEMAGVTDEMTITTRPLRQEVIMSALRFDFEGDGMIVSDSDIACYCRRNTATISLSAVKTPHVMIITGPTAIRNMTATLPISGKPRPCVTASVSPPLAFHRMRGVVDLYDASTDWIPIYDKSSLGGFYIACGTSGNQYKNAPIAGKMMTALVGTENGNDHDEAPLNWALPYMAEHQCRLLFT